MLTLETRLPAVAGSFYPAAPQVLRDTVARLLAQAPTANDSLAPKALIVPHAGYVYSGATAAAAYASLAPVAGRIRRVVLIGPAHRAAVRGLALPAAAAFATPLGSVRLATPAIAALDSLPQVSISDFAHQSEHSLEVQLPFLQVVFGDFELLPILVGQASAPEVAEVLEKVWGGDDTLVVVSSDLSHYLPEDAGRLADSITVKAMLHLDATIDHDQACGATPINGLLLAARHHGLHAELLAQTNSGPVSQREDSVVGYAALAFRPQPAAADLPDREARARTLTGLARQSIAAALGTSAEPEPPAQAWLLRPAASFVTLRGEQRQLRGCVGGLVATRPLAHDVMTHARAAAFHDPRFEPLRIEELDRISIEVSVLSTPEPLRVRSENELAAELRPGLDGLVLQAGALHATFLPQVWDQLPAAHQFIAQLKRKAGLAAQDWSGDWRFSRYTVEPYEER